MAVTAETLRLAAGLRAQLEALTDAQTRDLVRAWAEAWDEVAPDVQDALLNVLTAARDDGRVTRAMLLRSARLQNSLGVIAESLQTLAGEAGVRISGDLDRVVREAGEAQEAIIASQLPPAERALVAGWDRVDPEQIAAIVERSTQQVTSLSRPLAPTAYQAVRRELIRGVAAGSNPRETARRMVRRAEGGFNGGLTRALVIARTETLDAHRRAAQVAQQADDNADVLGAWAWNAKLDTLTCPACWSMHGRRFDLTEPGPLGHQQCRCGRLPKTRSWAELGFEGIEEPPDLMPDAGRRFEVLSAVEQEQVLGPKRYRAWLAGEYPMEGWAARRSTDGWRDSYVVAPVTGAGGGAGSGGGGAPPPTGGNGGDPPEEPLPPRPPADTPYADEDEAEAIWWYTVDGHDRINAEMRSGNVGERQRRWIELIDAFLARNPTAADYSVLRVAPGIEYGVTASQEVAGLVGRAVLIGGYMSATTLEEPLPGKLREAKDEGLALVVDLVVPAGTLGAYIGGHSEFRTENEFVIAHGLTVRVTSARYDDDLDVWRLVAVIVPEGGE